MTSRRIALFVTTILFLMTAPAAGQWNTNSNGINYNGGNVGIGDSNPLAKLHIYSGSSGRGLNLVSGKSGNTHLDFNGTNILSHATVGKFRIRRFDGSQHLSDDFVVDGSGRVGVGTSSPVQALHVEGDVRFGHNGNDSNSSYALTIGSAGEFLYDGTGGEGDVEWKIDFANRFQVETRGRPEDVLFDVREDGVTVLSVSGERRVGIGTTSPSQKLTVKGGVLAEEVTVKLAANWPDYVFADDYDLPTLDDVRAHIEQHGHLPEVPSAETVAAQGVQVGATQAVLLKKIEELTLYAIDQEEAVSAREKEARAQARRIKELEAQNARLQEQVGAQQETIDWLVEKVSSDE